MARRAHIWEINVCINADSRIHTSIATQWRACRRDTASHGTHSGSPIISWGWQVCDRFSLITRITFKYKGTFQFFWKMPCGSQRAELELRGDGDAENKGDSWQLITHVKNSQEKKKSVAFDKIKNSVWPWKTGPPSPAISVDGLWL